MRVTPGTIRKDGAKFQVVGTELEAFVEGTDISELGLENFSQRSAPFVVSSTDPPSEFSHGMLWFKRGEGRFYTRCTRGPVQAFFNGGGLTSESNGGRYTSTGQFWVCVSDRKEVVAHHYTIEPEHWTIPWQAVRFGGGTIQQSELQHNSDSVHWASKLSNDVTYSGPTGLWAEGNNAFVGCRMESWGERPLSQKYFVHTTDYTVMPRWGYVGVFHELGYRRVGAGSGVSEVGPYHGLIEGTFALGGSNEYSDIDALHREDRRTHVVHKSTAGAGIIGYDSGYIDRSAYVAFVTESGPPKVVSDEATPRMLAFWFSTSPIRNFEQSP